jgi:nucleotide-binding universal stress UspA family protein
MKCIVVATDGSEGAQRAVATAAALAKDSGADLIIANVIGGYEFPGEIFQRLSRPQNVWFHELLAAESANVLKRAQEAADAHGTGKVDLVSRMGDPSETILRIADERNADAIVVGKRGLGRVAGILVGSLSQKLISLATRVVIVVP